MTDKLEVRECPICDGQGRYKRPHLRGPRICHICKGDGVVDRSIAEFYGPEPEEVSEPEKVEG